MDVSEKEVDIYQQMLKDTIFLLSVLIWTNEIMLSKFSAKVSGTCKPCFFCDGKNRFLSGIEQFGSLCQPVLDEICHWGNVDTRLEKMF